MTNQQILRDAWQGGMDDRLCAREQAKAWALREVWREDGKSEYGLHTFVASRVKKNKKGKPTGAHPTRASMQEFFNKIDADPEWYPGKQSEEKRGPKRTLRGSKVICFKIIYGV